MTRLLTIAFYLILSFTSCGQKNCKITDYHSINWQIIDSTTSFYICSNSDTKLATTDFIEIEYLGILQKDDNLVIQKETDQAVLSILTNAKFGQFKVSDTTLSNDIRHIISLLTKKSEATIRVNLGSLKPIELDKKITVYFKDNVDSTKAAKWIKEIKTKPFVDSTYYLSKEGAIKSWTKDQSDSSWLKLLKDNPLPTSVDIFIKQTFLDTVFIKNLKEDLMKSNLVSDVVYSNILVEDNLKEFTKILSNTYLMKVRPKE